MNGIIHFTNFTLDFPQIETNADLVKACTFMKDISKAFTLGAYNIGDYLNRKEEESQREVCKLGAQLGMTPKEVEQSIEFATLGRELNLSVSQIEEISKVVTKDLPDLDDHVPAMIDHLKNLIAAQNA